MNDLDDYRQRMREKFEKEQGGNSRSGAGVFGGLFQSKETHPPPMSDYELAKQMQENEMKDMSGQNAPNQNSQNTYDFRGGSPNQYQALNEKNNDYYQQHSANNQEGIELNDFTNPRNKRTDTMPLRSTMDTRPRSTWFQNNIGLLSSQIKEQMTPTAKYCCYLAGFFVFLIFVILLKSL